MSIQSNTHPALSGADPLANVTSDFILLVGRVMLGWIFVRSGYAKMFDVAAVANSFPVRGLHPWLAYISVPLEFFGGIALILGFATRYFVLAMTAFMVVATFSSHRYWDFTEAAARRSQESSFYKNVAIQGGLLFLFACGAGRLSLDNLLRRRN
jgi:putative oxidoreductase